jgi:hypothetical protein
MRRLLEGQEYSRKPKKYEFKEDKDKIACLQLVVTQKFKPRAAGGEYDGSGSGY